MPADSSPRSVSAKSKQQSLARGIAREAKDDAPENAPGPPRLPGWHDSVECRCDFAMHVSRRSGHEPLCTHAHDPIGRGVELLDNGVFERLRESVRRGTAERDGGHLLGV